MTNPTKPPDQTRVFKYADKTFPDPGSQYTTQQVLQHLRTFFPELGHARTEEKQLPDGTLEITFSKQVTRKGAGPADDPVIAALVAELAAVPEFESPLTPVWEALAQTEPLTLAALRAHSDLLRERAGLAGEERGHIWEVLQACKKIDPIPLPQLPWGF